MSTETCSSEGRVSAAKAVLRAKILTKKPKHALVFDSKLPSTTCSTNITNNGTLTSSLFLPRSFAFQTGWTGPVGYTGT